MLPSPASVPAPVPACVPDPVPGFVPAFVPNTAIRRLRGDRSPAEFAAAVRRAAHEIGEHVSCDARYIGRLESGEIRCPNYAYERVFRHMFPGHSPADLGFAPRQAVRGRRTAASRAAALDPAYEESEVQRRAFVTGGPAAFATALLPRATPPTRAGAAEVAAVREAVRQIRLHDDRHGGDGLYAQAAGALRGAYRLLDDTAHSAATGTGLASGAGELAVSVGWLAHDSGRLPEARSHYAEALATARMAADPALEAHAFCNTSFLARDAGRHREAVRAAQAAQLLARDLGSPRLLSLLALREAGGLAGLGERRRCELALARAHTLYSRGAADADPPWMSFFGEAELAGLEAQAWAALGRPARAAAAARHAVRLQDPHFVRNLVLYQAELAINLRRSGDDTEAVAVAGRARRLLPGVRSARVRAMLATV
ncbi:tetratricopeptide repeat protein [Streptomyces sp. NBC_01477]|uniref:tetratricopeptide repeat protein n=1 Tax=Streptomyces sp. NBC_01477 TaxID=2976015 RepID=UPI002E31C8D8|nr:tetratricopeptide repeat protein [Streptomyces sp. NBC_01477]